MTPATHGNLFQTPSKSFGDAEVHKGDRDGTTSSVDPSDHGSQTGLLLIEEVGQGESDGPSADPESSGSDGHDLGLVLSVRELGSTGPGERTPSQVEGPDVEHDHGNDS